MNRKPRTENPKPSVLIVGAGLAGACAAAVLSRTHAVTLLDAAHPAAGASGAAAGLVNPFMARKANPVWRYAEALDALHELLADADASSLFRSQGVLRPAGSPKQAGFFQETAAAFPADARWWPAGEAAERFPEVRAEHGALWLLRGGSVEIPAFVEALLALAQQRGATLRLGGRVTDFGEADGRGFVTTEQGERIEATTLLLCLGGGFVGHPALEALGLHRVKGQTVRVRRPDALTVERLAALPALSAGGYIVPAPEADDLVVGASFEHDFADVHPSPGMTRQLLAKARQTLPALADAAVTHEVAGVRVTRHGARKPLLGPLPGWGRVWVFTALGAKGLLTAPLLARRLPDALTAPETLAADLRPCTEG